MKRMISQSVIGVVLITLVLYANALGQVKEFPTKYINVYSGYSPGGGATISGTIVFEGMKKYFKQPVILNYKPGAIQAIAAEYVINSSPDGYTLFYVYHMDLTAKIAKDHSKLKFGIEDLDSLGSGIYTPIVCVVNAESPWKTVDDFIAAARKSPGSLTNGSPGYGGTGHLLGELFAMKTGIVLNHVPFAGGPPAVSALLGGHTQVMFMTVGAFGAHIKPGGRLRPLVVFEKKRVLGFPDVPTAIEKGIDMPLMRGWWGLQAPKELPKAVRATLVEAFKNTLKDPEIISALNKVEYFVDYTSPDEVDKKIQEEYNLFLDVWKKVGLEKK